MAVSRGGVKWTRQQLQQQKFTAGSAATIFPGFTSPPPLLPNATNHPWVSADGLPGKINQPLWKYQIYQTLSWTTEVLLGSEKLKLISHEKFYSPQTKRSIVKVLQANNAPKRLFDSWKVLKCSASFLFGNFHSVNSTFRYWTVFSFIPKSDKSTIFYITFFCLLLSIHKLGSRITAIQSLLLMTNGFLFPGPSVIVCPQTFFFAFLGVIFLRARERPRSFPQPTPLRFG